MTTLKHAWVIVRSDFRGDRLKLLWALLFAVLFMGYMAVMGGMIFDDAVSLGEGKLISDVLLVTIICIMGVTFSRRNMKYLADDTYTRLLAYMRTLPVPAAVILCRRQLNTLFAFTVNGALYFSLIYAIGASIRRELPVPAYLAFALTWIGFGLIIAGLFIFIEFSVSGKMYFVNMIAVMFLGIGAAGLIRLAGGNMLLSSVAVSKEWGLLSPLMWGSLLLGTLSVQLFSRWTIHRLKSRDLV
ncbi:hypothetical protein [Paenibacillus sp. MMS20-IR301]|uniref:hypothetical protein n=1 Tax=Paenibacillus sp. MMS20-IR301 TaxID=2895946 RepID=UPI0028F015C5|nr:hypothetical protein [Paenibacillus sp. MMS20-IR301]WNS41726.1 hypothetical protein LOS79_22270 [Paenibacillus sp. MMS20-IR301]